MKVVTVFFYSYLYSATLVFLFSPTKEYALLYVLKHVWQVDGRLTEGNPTDEALPSSIQHLSTMDIYNFAMPFQILSSRLSTVGIPIIHILQCLSFSGIPIQIFDTMDLSTTHNIVLAELRVILRMKYYKAVFISKIHFPKYTIHDINWTSTIVLISFLSILLHPLYKAAMWG